MLKKLFTNFKLIYELEISSYLGITYQRFSVHSVEFRWPDLKQKISPDPGVFPMSRRSNKGILIYCK